jgi:hypothetical protein
VAGGAFGSPVCRAHTCSPCRRSVPLPSAHALPFHQLHVPAADEGGDDGASSCVTVLALTARVRPPCLRVLSAVHGLCVLYRAVVPVGLAAPPVRLNCSG